MSVGAKSHVRIGSHSQQQRCTETEGCERHRVRGAGRQEDRSVTQGRRAVGLRAHPVQSTLSFAVLVGMLELDADASLSRWSGIEMGHQRRICNDSGYSKL
jgi:hypothetical protein